MKRSREAEEDPDSDHSPVADGNDKDYDGRSPSADADEQHPQHQQQHRAKFTLLDPSEPAPATDFTMKCYLPGHREGIAFNNYGEYQSHYHKLHTNRCLECRSNLPSAHLLAVHIEECHDSFVAVKRDRGEHTYSCFVEGCDRKCMTPQKRRLHLIDKHMYPRNFYFAVTKRGIDGRRSLLIEDRKTHHRRGSSNGSNGDSKAVRRARRRSSQDAGSPPAADGKPETSPRDGKDAATPAPAPASAQTPTPNTDSKTSTADPKKRQDTEMDDLTGAMSALQFVPNSVRFGRGGGKAGFSKK